MANNEFKYLLEFQSIATGNGAKETVQDLQKIEAGAKSLTIRQADLNAEYRGVSDRFDVTRTAFYDLDAAQTKAAKSSETFTAGATNVRRSSGNAATSLLLFSQGFEDLQYGIRGVLNNIPGLVIALGGGAGLAGAISIAAVAGNALFTMLTRTEEKASDVADRIKAIADNMAAAETDRFDAVGSSIDAAAEAAGSLRQNWDEARAADAAFSTAALTNAEKVAVAQRLIAEALGAQVDRFKELEVIAQREAAARELAAKQALEVETVRKQKAADEVTLAADALGEVKNRQNIEAANLVQLRAELELLRQKRDQLTEIAKQRAESDDPGVQLLGGVFPGLRQKTDAAIAAEKSLADPAFQAGLAGTQARVDKLEELVRGLAQEGNGAVAKAENALNLARTKQADTNAAVETNIARITETLNADTLLAKSTQLVQTGEQLAASIQDSFGKIETTNARGVAAKESLAKATEDGRITADEVATAGRDLVTLVGLIQSGQAQYTGTVTELIGVQREFVSQQAGIRNEIANLREAVEGLKARK